MTTLELKNFLFLRIAAIDDFSLLNNLRDLLERKSESKIYQTSAEQKAQIKEAQAQIRNGEFYTEEFVESEVELWLNEK